GGALLALVLLAGAGWLVARSRLLPRRPIRPEERLAGHSGALLALGVVGLLLAATNPFALVFVLPSLHAWLWLPQVQTRHPGLRATTPGRDDRGGARRQPVARRSQRTVEPAASSPFPRGMWTRASAAAERTIMCDSWPVTGSSTSASPSTRDRARTNSSRSSFRRRPTASCPGSKRGNGSARPCRARRAG